MKRKLLLLGIILLVGILFIVSCKESEPEPYPTDISVNNFPEYPAFPGFPEDRRIPAPEFTYTLSGNNAILKWKNISNIEYYILYGKIIDGNYITDIKTITLDELKYDSNFSSNKYVTYTVSLSELNSESKLSNSIKCQFGLRAVSVDGIKSEIYWAPQPN